jgi:uncharacterized protein (TIGR03437 family)
VTLPAGQTLAVAAAAGTAAPVVHVAFGGRQWLTLTPLTGKTPLSVKITVNPTTLPVGQYSDTIGISTPETGGDPVFIPVTLTIKAVPSDLRITPTTLSVTYRLGDPLPQPVYTHLSTTGVLLSYTAAVTGTKWMRLAPASGAVFPGFRSNISISTDITDLPPGTQKGTFTINAPDAVTKTTTVTVNLTIQPGVPVVTSLWPPRVIRGAPDTTVTITGERFFSGTVLKSGTVTLRTTILGTNSLLAVIPAALMANPGNVPIIVSNPDPGGGTAHLLNLEVLPPGPLILAAVNAASQRPANIAPGEVITIYGSGLGPDTLTAFDGNSPFVPANMGGTKVYLNGESLPVIYSSARQVSAAAPTSLQPDRPGFLVVEYDDIQSVPYPVLSAKASPAIFTTSGAGTGNAAAFQADAATGNLVLNSDKTPAVKGDILVLYATGLGPTLPIPWDGFVATEPSAASIPNVSVLLGDINAEVLYAGATPGLITGIVQINARIPDNAPTGKAVPLTVRVENIASPAGVTLNIK